MCNDHRDSRISNSKKPGTQAFVPRLCLILKVKIFNFDLQTTVDSTNNMQGNLTELDLLLQDLYSTDEPPDGEKETKPG